MIVTNGDTYFKTQYNKKQTQTLSIEILKQK
jgi:hypothetical protein